MDELLLRQMPHSTEAEQAVLGSMLIDAACVKDVMDQLQPDDFYLRQNREIFETIYTMFVYSRPIDGLTVAGELEKAGLSELPVGERNILLLVCRELLCAVAEPYVYEAVTATFTCGGQTFTAKGRRILSEGWREIDHIFRASLKEQPEGEAEPAALPDFTEGQLFDQVEAAVTEHFTAPPKAYTEDICCERGIRNHP